MSLVLEEWGLTTDAAELKIRNWPKHDLDAENLNLYYEKISARMRQYLKGTEHGG